MQNITRTLNKFEVKAYDLVDNEDGIPTVVCVAECVTFATSMTKADARAALKQNVEKLPKGLNIKWREIGYIKYAMPLDTFLENAVVVEEHND